MPLVTAAYRFGPGHRLRVMIAAADFQNSWPTPLAHTLTIHQDADAPSCIELPLAGHREPIAEPVFRPSDFEPLPPDQIPTPDFSVIRDLIRNAATVDIRTQSGCGINRSRTTVFVDRPAETVVQSEFEYPLNRPGKSIRVRANCVTAQRRRTIPSCDASYRYGQRFAALVEELDNLGAWRAIADPLGAPAMQHGQHDGWARRAVHRISQAALPGRQLGDCPSAYDRP